MPTAVTIPVDTFEVESAPAENIIVQSAPVETVVETTPVQSAIVENIVEHSVVEHNAVVENTVVENNAVVDSTVLATKATGMELGKTESDSGFVLIRLEDSAPFKLSRTAPSEYILNLPGVDADSHIQSLNSPLLAPKGLPGIRSVRASRTHDGLSVRMFVDANVDLQAYPRGNEILVEAIPSNFSKDPNSRAQLAEEESSDAANVDLGEDSTARLNPTGIRSADGSKIYTGRLISLDLQDTDIDNALRIIAEVSNLNIIASDDAVSYTHLTLPTICSV